MGTAVAIVAVIIVAIIIIILMNHITRLRFERRFRDWQDKETLRWQMDMEQARKAASKTAGTTITLIWPAWRSARTDGPPS